jgi:hypothetical protein
MHLPDPHFDRLSDRDRLRPSQKLCFGEGLSDRDRLRLSVRDYGCRILRSTPVAALPFGGITAPFALWTDVTAAHF